MGAGTLTLTSPNITYSGGTTINGGTLNISSNLSLGSLLGGLTMGGGTLQWGLAFNSARTITLNAGGGTFDTNGYSGTLSGAIGGTGGLTKTGAGMLTLDGANTYTGGTTVNAGTLQLGTGSLAGTGALTVNGGTFDFNGNTQTVGALSGTGGTVALGAGALTVNQTASTIYAGAIAGTGTLTKTGSGTLILNGINTYTGLTTVSGGTLEVGDANNATASLAGSVSVGAAGTLAGHGTVGADVTNNLGGIVSPGGSIGTLTVAGNYTQGANSTLAIEVSPTAASKLAVTGTANLAGTPALTYTPGVYTARSYTIVQAGSVAGTFGTVTGTAPSGLGQSLSYGPTTVTLTLAGFTVAPTATGVLGQVGTVALSGAQSANSLLMSHLGGAPWNDGLGSQQAAAFAPMQLAFAGNTGDLASLLSEAPRAVASSGGWVRGYGGHSSLDNSSTAAGFSTNDSGFLAGYDREVNRDVKVGLAGGYGHSRLHSRDGGSATLTSPRLMAYGSWQPGLWAVDIAVGYAYDTIDTARPQATGTAAASHRAQEFTAEAQVRAGFDVSGLTVIPATGLRYVRVIERRYTETGAGGNNLSVDGRTVESTQPFVGVSAARAFDLKGGIVCIPRAELEYAHELNHTSAATVTVGGGTFTAAGAVPSRNRLTAGLGLNGKLRDDLLLDLSYRVTQTAENYRQYALAASLRYRF